MKKTFLFSSLLIFLSFPIFSQSSIQDALKAFDMALMDSGRGNAEVTVGFFTYADTDTCGSIVSYLQKEIQIAAEETRRIKVVKSKDFDDCQQSVVATRGLKMVKTNSASVEKKYILNGKYFENGQNIEIKIDMLESTSGKVFVSKSAYVSRSVVNSKNLTLFPENKKLSEDIKQDFAITEEKEIVKVEEKAPVEKKKKQAAKQINVSASMLDGSGNLVNLLHPNDIVKFKVTTDSDCYLAILCIDANGIKQWLPISNNYVEAGVSRLFPDLRGQQLRVADDGVFGAEQVIIYASSDEKGLPAQTDSGKYSSQDLQQIMRKQRLVRQNADYATGSFKITYTIVRR